MAFTMFILLGLAIIEMVIGDPLLAGGLAFLSLLVWILFHEPPNQPPPVPV